MDLKETLKRLKINISFLEFIEPGWPDSIASMPERIEFLDPEIIKENMDYCGMPEKYFDELKAEADRIKSDSALSAFAWHCRWQLYNDRSVNAFDDWPLCGSLPELYLLAALAMVPLVRKKHSELGIDERITRDTCRQVDCFCSNHIHGYGRPGIIPQQMSWFRHYVDGFLFRLGRMEYRLKEVSDFGKAFKNKVTGAVVAFAPSGVRYNKKGYIDGSDEILDDSLFWESSYLETENSITGNPVSPLGFVMKDKMSLKRSEWECLIKEGDYFLDMHIPSGGGMKPEACIDSMRKAVEFFERHFPEKKTKAVMCRSWIFNTQFEDKMSESNLAKFMRELYLFPVPSSGKDGFFFVFCKEYDDLSQAPRDTSLQRAMLDILKEEPLRAGGMFILNEDLKYFGSQHYRNQKLEGLESD